MLVVVVQAQWFKAPYLALKSHNTLPSQRAPPRVQLRGVPNLLVDLRAETWAPSGSSCGGSELPRCCIELMGRSGIGAAPMPRVRRAMASRQSISISACITLALWQFSSADRLLNSTFWSSYLSPFEDFDAVKADRFGGANSRSEARVPILKAPLHSGMRGAGAKAACSDKADSCGENPRKWGCGIKERVDPFCPAEIHPWKSESARVEPGLKFPDSYSTDSAYASRIAGLVSFSQNACV